MSDDKQLIPQRGSIIEPVVGPTKTGRGTVQFLLRVTLSFVVVLLFYTGMVTAFHLLNLPSNLAVFAGIGLLLLLAVGGFVAFRAVWKRW